MINQSTMDDAIKEKLLSKTPLSREEYRKAGKTYFDRMSCETFKALVLDFDRTIHNKYEETKVEDEIKQFLNEMLAHGIMIGISTGNGEYITEDLKRYFDQQYHSEILIGYYNCGIITSLDKEIRIPSDESLVPMDFSLVKQFFFGEALDQYIIAEGLESNNPYELNFYSDLGNEGAKYLDLLKTYIKTHTSLKILESPHSFDVIPGWFSKADLCKYMEYKHGINSNEILTIGDCGAEGESDYELLCRECSLSVGSVSNALNSCWKYTSADCKNLDATWSYFRTITYGDRGSFKILQK